MGGIAAFATLTLISYLLILANVPVLILPITLIFVILSAKPFVKIIKSIKIKLNFLTIATFLVFALGIAGQMAIISPSGVFKNGDLLFWSAHGHDGAWHIALMEEIKRGWPFQNPSFAGERLLNYHFFSDILPAIFSKYTPLTNLDLYFRIFPFFYSLFLGASAYFLTAELIKTKGLSKNSTAPLWATIFTYFAGSFGFIATYIKNKTWGGESIFWATQPQSASGNPPQIISDFLILSALYFLIKFGSEKGGKTKNILFIICVVIFGTLASFKVYAGVVALISLGIYGLWKLIKEKRWDYIFLTILSGILSAGLYFPNTSGSASFLIFQPWWYIRTMVVEPSRLNWIDLELRRQFYLDRGGVRSILRIVEYEGVAFLIFFFGNLGMRFLGLKKFIETNIFIKTAVIVSLISPLLFLQKGVASNTSQFLQYFVLFFGILAGMEISKITKKVKILIPFIIILMIPTQVSLLYEFYSRPAFAKISAQELEALSFIKDESSEDVVIISPPYNQYLDLKENTPNIWDWFDTSYVAAFSERRTYFEDYEQADIMGYNWKERSEVKKAVFESKDKNEVKNLVDKTEADILYYPKAISPKINPEEIGFKKLFENEEASVWKTN